MKKLLLTVSTSLCLTFSAFCQKDKDTVSSNKYVYCELVGTARFLSTKVNISLDYGEQRNLFQDTRLKNDETGKLATFNSMVDALNYMGNSGWELVQAYVVSTGNQLVYHWMLKKKK